MKHFFLIDPIEKLNPKKDSTFLLMLSLQQESHQVYALYTTDLYISNSANGLYSTKTIEGKIHPETFYLENVRLLPGPQMDMSKGDFFHMRLDPPFDERYLKILWILAYMQDQGVYVLNNPLGIMNTNEKLSVFHYNLADYSFILSNDKDKLFECVQKWYDEEDIKHVILKPLNLYQGFGVTKLAVEELLRDKQNIKIDLSQQWIVLPFFPEVYQGEYRSSFFLGEHLATIKKVPPSGSFLANIAQGASFTKAQLPETVYGMLQKNAKDLMERGISWVAYDCIGTHVTEINVTCPGLLVELSSAVRENLGLKITHKLAANNLWPLH